MIHTDDPKLHDPQVWRRTHLEDLPDKVFDLGAKIIGPDGIETSHLGFGRRWDAIKTKNKALYKE